MSKLLILGGSGMLGTSLVAACKRDSIPFEAPSSTNLDIRKIEDLRRFISKENPFAIVNCAAWTDVENAEREQQRARDLNAAGVQNIAFVAGELGINVVHISTDYVFNGSKSGKYSENDETDPINSYGVSKLLGENRLLEILPNSSYIIRTSWLYGAFGRNFAKTIIKKALTQERIHVVHDQVGSPTNSVDLAQGIIAILERSPKVGIYHFSNEGQISWFEFARKLYDLIGSPVRLVEPIDSQSFSGKVLRPANSVLSTEKWSKAKITEVIQWDESLARSLPEILDTVRNEMRI